jgi:hypothetical protein
MCTWIATKLFGCVILPAVTLLHIQPASASAFVPPADEPAPEITRGGATRVKSEEGVRWTPCKCRGSATTTMTGGRR